MYTCTHRHTQAYTCMHTERHTCIQTHMHMHAHAYTHTHTHTVLTSKIWAPVISSFLPVLSVTGYEEWVTFKYIQWKCFLNTCWSQNLDSLFCIKDITRWYCIIQREEAHVLKYDMNSHQNSTRHRCYYLKELCTWKKQWGFILHTHNTQKCVSLSRISERQVSTPKQWFQE